MKIKTADLIGPALDWAVSLITNPEWTDEDRWYNTLGYVDCGDPDDEPYAPSSNWSQGGPIIERQGISLNLWAEFGWRAGTRTGKSPASFYSGPTPLIAAMRCFVASHLGEEVEIPEELL